MGRRPAAITRDEVARTIKGVQDCGLRILSIQLDDGKLVVNVDNGTAAVAAKTPADIDNLEDYDAWRDKRNADRNRGHPHS